MAEEIKLKITLDDGSVREGFLSLEKEAKKLGDSAGGKSGIGKIVDSFSSIGDLAKGLINPYTAAAAAVGLAAKQMTEFAIAGEKAAATQIQFKNVASQAALAADQLSEAIIKQTDGLIDDTDALEVATKSIVALGNEAGKLPDVLAAARNISRTLGKDFKETFENLSSFLENGNARLLRQYGIVLDLDAAYTKAATAVGLTTAQLTEQQKQTIRLNLALEELPKRFSAGEQSVTPLSDALTRLFVKAKNGLEELQKSFANAITTTFIDNADKSNVATSRLTEQFKEASDEVSRLEKTLQTLTERRLKGGGIDALAALTVNIDQTKKKLKEARAELSMLLVEMSARSDQELFSAMSAAEKTNPAEKIKLTEEQMKKISEERKQREASLTEFILGQEVQRRNADLETVNQKEIAAQQITSAKLRELQQLEILELQHKQALISVEKQFSNEKKFTTKQREEAVKAVNDSFQSQRLKVEKDTADQIKQIQNDVAANGIRGIYSMADALIYLGQQAKQQLAGAFVSGMQAATNAIAKGENGMDALLKSVLRAIADIAVQFGTLFLLQAAGFAVIPGLQGNASALAAAGIGLIGLGIALKALAGSEGGATAPTTGGGVAASPSPTTELTPQDQLQRQEPGTSVSVVVQGDILDSEESGSRIVSLINDAFNKKGVVIQQGVMA